MQRDSQKPKHIGLVIDFETHHKLFYIARYEGRSGNGEVLYLIRKCIADFEEEHGKIPPLMEKQEGSAEV